MNTDQADPRQSDEEIDLRELTRALVNRKYSIITTGFLSLLLSAAYAFFIAKPVFISSALLIPTQTQPTGMELGAAAALLGGKKNSSPDVDLYQSLLSSRTVIQKLLQLQIPNQSDTAKGKMEPIYQILGIDMNVPLEAEMAVRDLSSSVAVGSKESGAGGILEIKFSANSSWLAQEIGNNLLKIGQEELRLIRHERADLVMSRLIPAVEQAKAEWDSTSRILAHFKDRNRSVVLPEQMLQQYRLEIEKSAKEQKYLLVRKEYELQSLEKAKAAPPMMILDWASLPAKKSKPSRALIMALGLLAGLLGSTTWILARKTFASA